jgi:hypothetical protein
MHRTETLRIANAYVWALLTAAVFRLATWMNRDVPAGRRVGGGSIQPHRDGEPHAGEHAQGRDHAAREPHMTPDGRSDWHSAPRLTAAALAAAVALLGLLLPDGASAQATQARRYPLESAKGLRLHNVTAEPVTYKGKRGLRVTTAADAQRRVDSLPVGQQSQFERLAVIEGTSFANGVIEAEIAGAPGAGAAPGARGFVGIAFRVQPDMRTYDAFYLRPTNGRAEDQERRNHSAQYISHPEWTWNRFRNETPSRYESYVDLVPGAWTKVRIEIRGTQARLFVHDQPQPTLIVNDLKTGAEARGAIALWIDVGTVAHFRNLRVRSLDGR